MIWTAKASFVRSFEMSFITFLRELGNVKFKDYFQSYARSKAKRSVENANDSQIGEKVEDCTFTCQ